MGQGYQGKLLKGIPEEDNDLSLDRPWCGTPGVYAAIKRRELWEYPRPSPMLERLRREEEERVRRVKLALQRRKELREEMEARRRREESIAGRLRSLLGKLKFV